MIVRIKYWFSYEALRGMEPASQIIPSAPAGWQDGHFNTSHPQLPQLALAFRNLTAAPSRMIHPSLPSSFVGRSQLQEEGQEAGLRQDLASRGSSVSPFFSHSG